MENRVKLKVLGITYSQIQAGAYALVLAEEEGPRRIPIIIGTAEAQAIAIKLERLNPPRPLTHDLFITFAQAFGIKLLEVFIYKFAEGVFSAELLFEDKEEHQVKIDSRTSDAISIAIRCGAPIYTIPEIVEEAGVIFEDFSHDGDAASPMMSGVSPSQDIRGFELEELKERLKLAVEKENYEEASHIRDLIRQKEESDSKKTGRSDKPDESENKNEHPDDKKE